MISFPLHAVAEEDANRLFVEASLLWGQFSESDEQDTKVGLRYLLDIEERISEILSLHPESSVAVKIASEAKEGLDLWSIRQLIGETKESICYAEPSFNCVFEATVEFALDVIRDEDSLHYRSLNDATSLLEKSADKIEAERALPYIEALEKEVEKRKYDPFHEYAGLEIESYIYGLQKLGKVKIAYDLADPADVFATLKPHIAPSLEILKATNSLSAYLAIVSTASFFQKIGLEQEANDTILLASDTYNLVEKGSYRSRAISDLLDYTIANGYLEWSEVKILSALSVFDQFYKLIELAKAYAEKNDTQNALRVLNAAMDARAGYEDAGDFIAISEAFRLSGKGEKAEEYLKRAEAALLEEKKVANNNDYMDSFSIAYNSAQLAREYLNIGLVEKSISTLRAGYQQWPSAAVSGTYESVLVAVADQLHQSGDTIGAIRLAREAAMVARNNPDGPDDNGLDEPLVALSRYGSVRSSLNMAVELHKWARLEAMSGIALELLRN